MYQKTFEVKLSFLPVLYSVGFPKKTSTLVPINVEKRELLTFIFSKFEIVWLRFQYWNQSKGKIGPKTVDAMFIGYALDSNVNQFLVVNSENSEISKNTIIEVRDVYFENIFIYESRIPSDPSCTLSTSDIPSSSSTPVTDSEPRRSKRTRTLTSFGEDFFTYLLEGDPSSFKEQWTLLNLLSGKKPLTVRSSL